MVNFLKTILAWPNGIIVGNLMASVVWGSAAWIISHRRHVKHIALLKKHHKEQLDAIRNKGT